MNPEHTAFTETWRTRSESLYVHWTRGEPVNQIQYAFRNHWLLFQSLLKDKRFNRGKRVLEVGCGRGSLSCYFADAGYHCTLLDNSAEAISIAEKIYAKHGLRATFLVCDANAIRLPDKSVDIVFSIGLLEHLPHPMTTLSEQLRVLADGGLFIAYVVPRWVAGIQREYDWINRILEGYSGGRQNKHGKQKVYRNRRDSKRYLPMLRKLGLHGIRSSGIYPLPMISHSIEFPFTLMPEKSELALLKHVESVMKQRNKSQRRPWLCPEGFGQAFILWGFK